MRPSSLPHPVSSTMATAPRPFKQSLLAMLGISLVLMLSALDQTVIGNALPSIVADLHGFDLYAWVATGYLLTSIVTIPIFGRLGDQYGRKPFVMAAAAIFTAASLLCAMAPTMLSLVIGRVLQGVGGGILIGTAFACVPELFRETAQRLRWQMLLSVAFSVVNATGPTLGGVLTQHYGWRSVFYLNLPLGAISLWFVWRYLPFSRPAADARGRLDWAGAGLIAVLLTSLQFFVEWLPHGDTLRTACALLVCTLAVISLIVWERRVENALLPKVLFADARLRGLFILSTLSGAILFVLLFYLPLLFQGAYAYSPGDAGLLITPLVLFITLGAIVNARIVARLENPKRLPLLGFLLILIGCSGLIVAGKTANFMVLLSLMFSTGLGFGFILLNLTLFTQTSAEPRFLGIATAIVQSTRLVGGMVGTALVGSLVSAVYSRLVQRAFDIAGAGSMASPFKDPRILFHAEVNGLQAQELQRLAAAGYNGNALLEAARLALTHAITIGLAMLCVITVLSIWRLQKMPRLSLPAKAK